jgi:hypothetical protein
LTKLDQRGKVLVNHLVENIQEPPCLPTRYRRSSLRSLIQLAATWSLA